MTSNTFSVSGCRSWKPWSGRISWVSCETCSVLTWLETELTPRPMIKALAKNKIKKAGLFSTYLSVLAQLCHKEPRSEMKAGSSDESCVAMTMLLGKIRPNGFGLFGWPSFKTRTFLFPVGSGTSFTRPGTTTDLYPEPVSFPHLRLRFVPNWTTCESREQQTSKSTEFLFVHALWLLSQLVIHQRFQKPSLLSLSCETNDQLENVQSNDFAWSVHSKRRHLILLQWMKGSSHLPALWWNVSCAQQTFPAWKQRLLLLWKTVELLEVIASLRCFETLSITFWGLSEGQNIDNILSTGQSQTAAHYFFIQRSLWSS